MPDAREWEQKALRYVQNQDFYRAAYCYEQAVAIDPRRPELWYRLAEIGQYSSQDPLALIEKALELQPNSADFLVLKSKILSSKIKHIIDREGRGYSEGPVEAAAECIDLALELDPHNIQALFIKADNQESEKAEELYKLIIQLLPDDEMSLLEIADQFWGADEEEKCLFCLNKAIALESNNSEFWVAASKQFERLSQLDKAFFCIDRAIALDTNNKEVWTEKYLMLKEFEGLKAASQIPPEKLNFRVQFSLLDFFKTGKLGPIHIGMKRSDLKAVLGSPEHCGGTYPTWPYENVCLIDNLAYPIWWYSHIEFHFGELEQRLYLIHCDHLDRIGYDGKVINLDAWIFDEFRPPSKEQLATALESEGIRYEHQELKYFGTFILESGVEIAYEYDDHQVSAISLYNDKYV